MTENSGRAHPKDCSIAEKGKKKQVTIEEMLNQCGLNLKFSREIKYDHPSD